MIYITKARKIGYGGSKDDFLRSQYLHTALDPRTAGAAPEQRRTILGIRPQKATLQNPAGLAEEEMSMPEEVAIYYKEKTGKTFKGTTFKTPEQIAREAGEERIRLIEERTAAARKKTGELSAQRAASERRLAASRRARTARMGGSRYT